MSSSRISRSSRVLSLRKIIAARGVSAQAGISTAGAHTGSNVVRGLAELLDGVQLMVGEGVLGVELDPEVEDGVGELGGIWGRVGLVEFLSAHGGGRCERCCG